MAKRGLSRLPIPEKPYRVDRQPEREDGKLIFETRQDAKREDRLRIALLRKGAANCSDPNLTDAYLQLANNLESGLTMGKYGAGTLASALYMRGQRAKVSGALWKLYNDCTASPPTTVATVIAEQWELSASDLALFDPVAMIAAFRSDINRVIDAKDGYLFAAIHGEYTPQSDTFRLHLHLQVSGSYVAALDTLRSHRKYKAETPSGRKRQRIKIQRGQLTDLPFPFTYRLQSFWPCKEWLNPEGEPQRKKRQRIPNPYHNDYLLWLDRWRLEDITLLMGLQVTRKGLMQTQ